MEKLFLAFIGFIVVGLICILPFISIIYGLYHAFNGYLISGSLFTVIGLFILWLVKPISIIMDKDFKIF